MRFLALLGAVLLAALAVPELPRYAAERRVGWATAAFREILDAPGGADTLRRLQATGEIALSTTTALPGDRGPG